MGLVCSCSGAPSHPATPSAFASPPSAASLPSSAAPPDVEYSYYSARIAEMIEKMKSNPEMDKVESEVEASKSAGWTELSPSEVVGDELAADNLQVFQSLREQWPFGVFKRWTEKDWDLGEKIAEGGQAELFEVFRDFSNVLFHSKESFDTSHDLICSVDTSCFVADYECSVGVVGTRFWRAPKILLAVENQNVTLDLFTEASDVYSYEMTCYEIITGHLPFEVEGYRANDYAKVIGGCRPCLPSGTPEWMKELLVRCWHKDPYERPTFREIAKYVLYEGSRAIGKMLALERPANTSQ